MLIKLLLVSVSLAPKAHGAWFLRSSILGAPSEVLSRGDRARHPEARAVDGRHLHGAMPCRLLGAAGQAGWLRRAAAPLRSHAQVRVRAFGGRLEAFGAGSQRPFAHLQLLQRAQGMNNPFRFDRDRDRRSFGLGFNTATRQRLSHSFY